MTQANSQARDAALQARDAFTPRPTSAVQYQSRGSVLVVCDDADWQLCSAFQAPLTLTGLITQSGKGANAISNTVLQGDRSIQISGHLGNFRIKLQDDNGISEELRADIVLDLQAQPALTPSILPPGYIHTSISAETAGDIAQELADMVGEFDKPKFFNYRTDICAHGVNGNVVCERCIQACPAEAISSIGR